ncbi:MAG: alanyl-tRNA editing protein [Pseudomonadota bacterium]
MTEELFRSDAYLKTVEAKVIATEGEGIITDRTVFYAMGGGQPGDQGRLTWTGGELAIADTVKSSDGILHKVAMDGPLPGRDEVVSLALNWERRHKLMRMHSLMHLLCASVEGDVTGGQISEDKSRLDFNIPAGAVDKESLNERLNALVEANHPISTRWISEEELDDNPAMVRTLSVKPPRGAGQVRLVCIGDPDTPVDLQPCGGTHVASTGEIGRVRIGKVENKGRQNRRINLHFETT